MYKTIRKAFNLPINFDPYSSQSFTNPLKAVTMGWETPFYDSLQQPSDCLIKKSLMIFADESIVVFPIVPPF